MRKTLEQEIAKFAFDKVKTSTEDNKKEFKKLPALIITNGLIPTLAYYKGEKIYEEISKWLKGRKLIQGDALEYLLNSDPATLRRVTLEVLKLAEYLKRFSEIE